MGSVRAYLCGGVQSIGQNVKDHQPVDSGGQGS